MYTARPIGTKISMTFSIGKQVLLLNRYGIVKAKTDNYYFISSSCLHV